MTTPEISKVVRCLETPSGEPVLVAYGVDGELLLSLRCSPKNVAKWLSQSVTTANRKCMERAVKDHFDWLALAKQLMK